MDLTDSSERSWTGAVAFADMVGYSTLMSTDSDRTHERWMSLLYGSLRPLAIERGGVVVKSTGDGVVAGFETVSDAFGWAQDVQHAVRTTDTPTGPPVSFRIGIDFGAMHATSADLYGTVVNTAARLQEHAPPGGIALTREAADLLPSTPALRELGPINLRSSGGSVRALAWDPPVPARVPRRPPISGVPSIAVLPLENLGGDPADLYFAAGIMDDVVNSLAALHELSVVARSATYGWPSPCDACLVGRALGVRYALCGSVRRSAGGLRLSIDLRETEDGDRIWSDVIDAPDRELFDVQDAIVARVVTKLAPAVRAAELRRALRRRPGSLTAYDLTLRGMYTLDSLERETFSEAGVQFERAIEEDPGYSMPVAWAAQWHSFAVGQGWTDAPEVDALLAGRLAQRATQLDPNNALGYAIAGHYRAYHLRDPASALPLFDSALEACPSHALAWTLRSGSLSYLGRGEEALECARRGLSLAPRGPHRFYYLCFMGIAYYARGEEADAIRWLNLSLRDSPGFTSAHRILMAALAGLGRIEEARAVAARMMECEPNFSLSAYRDSRAPFVDPALRAQLFARMRLAGVPD